LHGVIHAAGIGGQRQRVREGCRGLLRRLLAPKITGTLVLDEVVG